LVESSRERSWGFLFLKIIFIPRRSELLLSHQTIGHESEISQRVPTQDYVLEREATDSYPRDGLQRNALRRRQARILHGATEDNLRNPRGISHDYTRRTEEGHRIPTKLGHGQASERIPTPRALRQRSHEGLPLEALPEDQRLLLLLDPEESGSE